jgi:hypothetical protein
VVNGLVNDASLLLGNGNGSFQGPVNYQVGTNPVALAAVDFNADGHPDAVIANGSSNDVSVLLGTVGARLGSSTSVKVEPSPSASNEPVTITARIDAAAGFTSGTVTIKDGLTVLGASSLLGGRATLSVTLPAGTHSITASYSGDGIATGSTSAAFEHHVLASTALVSLCRSVADPFHKLHQPSALQAVFCMLRWGNVDHESRSPMRSTTYSSS